MVPQRLGQGRRYRLANLGSSRKIGQDCESGLCAKVPKAHEALVSANHVAVGVEYADGGGQVSFAYAG